MRLIDADKINSKDVIMGNSEFAKDIRKAMQDLIDSQPTAYDMDKVVEQLEERKKYLLKDFVLAEKAETVKEITMDRINEIDGIIGIIGIIKEGGVNECI